MRCVDDHVDDERDDVSSCGRDEGGGGDVAMVGEVEGMSLWWGRWRGCRYGGGGGGDVAMVGEEICRMRRRRRRTM